MSIIDQAAHTVVDYTSGKTKPFDGQHLLVCTWKTNNDKASPYYNIKRDSKAVSVPKFTDAELTGNIDVLIPHVRAMLTNVQKQMFREILDAGNDVKHIIQEQISLTACVDYLESSDESGRLTKESVGQWFDTGIAGKLALVLSDKLGISDDPTQEESDKILGIVGEFKKNISALAGGKTSYNAKVAAQLKKAIVLADDGDVIANKFIGRLDKMMAANEIDMLDAL